MIKALKMLTELNTVFYTKYNSDDEDNGPISLQLKNSSPKYFQYLIIFILYILNNKHK